MNDWLDDTSWLIGCPTAEAIYNERLRREASERTARAWAAVNEQIAALEAEGRSYSLEYNGGSPVPVVLAGLVRRVG